MNPLIQRAWPSLPPALVIAFVCGLGLSPVHAQQGAAASGTASASGSNAAGNSSFSPESAPAAPRPGRGISRSAAAALSAGITYAPPPPKPVEDENVDLRDIDKPKNEIVRLPTYHVTAQKPPVFTDRSLYTRDNLEKLAISRYLSKLDTNFLNRWTLPGFSNEARAMQMYYDEERQKNMETTAQQVSLYRLSGDEAKAEQTQRDYYDTALRRSNYVEPPASLRRY
ncbi:hypothetical protein OH491_09020 [Termitidicoccus mucosus]|uniref:Uncharacterized protein n=1 Tax=Termitidicoccus mucosus TaxID=1184151 RepID=A0A178IFG8_9BACT|nr:hypothetical protein AW736_20055 [Opitutaceae bacterium TSB47]